MVKWSNSFCELRFIISKLIKKDVTCLLSYIYTGWIDVAINILEVVPKFISGCNPGLHAICVTEKGLWIFHTRAYNSNSNCQETLKCWSGHVSSSQMSDRSQVSLMSKSKISVTRGRYRAVSDSCLKKKQCLMERCFEHHVLYNEFFFQWFQWHLFIHISIIDL